MRQRCKNIGCNPISIDTARYTASPIQSEKYKRKKRYHEKGSAKKWDDGIVKFDHGLGTELTTGFHAHCGTGTGDHHLTGEGGVIDCHVELKTLIMCLSRHTGTNEVDAVRYVIESIDRLHGNDVGLIVCEIIIGKDSRFNGLEIRPFFELDIDHTAMDTCSQGNSHGEGVLDAFDSLG